MAYQDGGGTGGTQLWIYGLFMSRSVRTQSSPSGQELYNAVQGQRVAMLQAPLATSPRLLAEKES